MKQHIILSALACSLALHAGGEVLFSDIFTYADGLLSQDSSSPWVTHGGTANQVESQNGVLSLSQSKSEDINAPLMGAPHRTGALYLSCLVNFVAPPSGDGTFFLHLKDAASTFKARLYASTNGVAPGSYRLGIANGTGAPMYVAAALDLTRSYRLVLRYVAASPTSSTLWIDPGSEAATNLRAEAVDSPAVSSIAAVALRQSLSAGDGMGTLLLDNLAVGTAFTDVAGPNTPPSISRIPDHDVGMDDLSAPIPFVVGDQETAAESLLVSFHSSNPAVIALEGIAVKGEGAQRSLRFKPVPGQQGSSRLTVTVSDGVTRATSSFAITVGAPFLAGPDSVEFPQEETSPALVFVVGDREISPGLLQLSALASNTNLFSRDAARWEGSGSNRVLRLTPIPGRSGISTVRVVVTDGQMSATNSLLATVYPSLGVLAADDFNRTDGPLASNSSGWALHAPDAPDVTRLPIRGGRVLLNEALVEDGHLPFAGGPVAANSGAILYAGLRVKVSKLPSSSGSFFAHFRDENNGFRARISLATSGASAGRFRFGIASGAGSPVFFPGDWALNEEHLLVCRYAVSTGSARLWIDPSIESDASVDASDSASSILLRNVSLRQADGIGELEVDDLKVAARFADVLPSVARPSLSYALSSAHLRLEWPADGGWILQSSGEAGSWTWMDVAQTATRVDGRARLERTMDGPAGFFRLIRH